VLIDLIVLFLLPMINLMLVALLIIFIMRLPVYLKFRQSNYGAISGNNMMKIIKSRGLYGEFLIFYTLEKIDCDHKYLLTNVYLPNGEGELTEIDLLMLTRKGIIVIESKNYSGWIFGDERHKMWTQTLKGGKRQQFFNPVWQNKGHIAALKKYVAKIHDDAIFSFIVFSERCELKKITTSSKNLFVIKRGKLNSEIIKVLDSNPYLLTEEEVDQIYIELKKMTQVSESVKENHIKSIEIKKSRMP
jgi:hypothetical protein